MSHSAAQVAGRQDLAGPPAVASLYALSPLVGRAAEVAVLRDLILGPSVRLLTVTGPVGVGKSRLAAAVFGQVRSAFPDGAYHIDLAATDAGSDLAEILLRAAGAAASDGTSAEHAARPRLAEYLAARECLFLLDHGEHVACTATELLPVLLASCPGVRVLLASHEPLRVYGEHVLRLTPLDVPRDGPQPHLAELEKVASVELFLQRARSARPGFGLSDRNRGEVSELCRKLDGLPLAIELAARRLKLYSIGRLLSELDDEPGLLCGDTTDTLSRHHSMRTAVEWSCARLSQAERLFLRRAAIFRGEFELSDAEKVTGAASGSHHDLVEGLVDKSLLMVSERTDGELAFSMLATTRSYALAELRGSGQLADLERVHAAHLLDVATGLEPRFSGRGRGRVIARLGLAHEDLRAAFRYFADRGDGARATALAASLRPFWVAAGLLREGAGWLEEALSMDVHSPGLLAKALAASGEIGCWLGHPAAAGQLERALAMYREHGDQRGAGRCLHRLGVLAGDREPPAARPLFDKAISALREAGDTTGHAAALTDLAEFCVTLGDLAEARRLAELSARTSLQLDDGYGAACAYRVLAAVAHGEGDDEQAAEFSRKAIRLLHASGDLPSLAANLEMLAALLVHRGKKGGFWAASARLLGAAHSIYDRIGYRPMRLLTAPPEQLLERARIRLGEHACESNWTAGRALPVTEAVAEALTPRPRLVDSHDAVSVEPLTPREFEIADLVARGLTNREIARRLGIAEWTAVNHLRKIMRKLECPSRVHVANWVALRRSPGPQPGARVAVAASW